MNSASTVATSEEIQFVAMHELRETNVAIDHVNDAIAEAPALEPLDRAQREQLATRVGQLLTAHAADTSGPLLVLLTSWGANIDEHTSLDFGGILVDPATHWPPADDALSFGAVRFDEVEISARVRTRQADGVAISSGGSGRIVRVASPSGLADVGDGPGQDLEETTTVQVRFDARLNNGAELELGFAMRWHESLNVWLPDCRFLVHGSDVVAPGYLF